MEYMFLFTLAAIIVGFIMTWGIGANDLANIMSTTMGSKALTVKQALVIAVIFEFAGAILGGSHVTATIRTGIINTTLLSNTPNILIYGMTSTLFAGAIWILFASWLGMPVSITNAIVGALVGFGTIVLGPSSIHWHKVSLIALSWVCSPTIACITSYFLFQLIKLLIFNADHPAKRARFYYPIFFVLVGIVLGNMTVLKGLAHFNIILPKTDNILISLGMGVLVSLIGVLIAKRIPKADELKRFKQFDYVEKLFSILMAFTACAMVFAHGSNDVAIAMGPVSAVISIIHNHGNILGEGPKWLPWFGCLGVVTGLIMYGRKVISTVGSEITTLTPSRAFAATIAGASTVIVSTSTGIPVSATQTLVGGVLGVGLARGIGALNITVIRNIFMSWLITVPAAAILTILFFYLFKAIFGG
ncbi:MAG: phosphate permease [Gammaproteobacteria bacterium RIFCSPHIGHO2_12_FULL_35_23]|nr:MAG: phosphate permease [Gammaproteobacteria bacterium RIFCSPHIGHO2_12_FULL_35_23]